MPSEEANVASAAGEAPGKTQDAAVGKTASKIDKAPPPKGPETHDDVTKSLTPKHIPAGVLIPLKTTLEEADTHKMTRALITRAPVKLTSNVIRCAFAQSHTLFDNDLQSKELNGVCEDVLRTMLPGDIVKSVPHLRRCAKPGDLPAHLKSYFMNGSSQSKLIHTGKSQWVYIMMGLEGRLSRDDITEIIKNLSAIEGMEEVEPFIYSVPVPVNPPSSQIQASLWSTMFWPTVYRKANPLGPHPSLVSKGTDAITEDADIFMAMARQVAEKSAAAGYGEAMGACVVIRAPTGKTHVVALAADARWHNREKTGTKGNPMGHAVLRAVSMVAQKLVRAEHRETSDKPDRILEYDTFQDKPILDDEETIWREDHPTPDGYLCHGLELYLTHEPCVMCSMAILHSRMSKVVFAHKMPLTGGISAEDRLIEDSELAKYGGGRGLGLFWRRELNWSLLAWEWEPTDSYQPLTVDPQIHA